MLALSMVKQPIYNKIFWPYFLDNFVFLPMVICIWSTNDRRQIKRNGQFGFLAVLLYLLLELIWWLIYLAKYS